MKYNSEHFKKFQEIIKKLDSQQEQGEIGFIPSKFYKDITCDGNIQFDLGEIIDINDLPNKKLSRSELIDLVGGSKISFIVKIICVFAWGSMKLENAMRFFGYYPNYGEQLREILESDLNRKLKYDKINNLKLKNCKPAYFTKLIFFFTVNKNSSGYIMDQWTAKSINLLLNGNLIKLDSQGYVAVNDSDVYENFCVEIEAISSQFIDESLNPSKIEELLFDRGGKKEKKGEWRTYIIKEWNDYIKHLPKKG